MSIPSLFSPKAFSAQQPRFSGQAGNDGYSLDNLGNPSESDDIFAKTKSEDYLDDLNNPVDGALLLSTVEKLAEQLDKDSEKHANAWMYTSMNQGELSYGDISLIQFQARMVAPTLKKVIARLPEIGVEDRIVVVKEILKRPVFRVAAQKELDNIADAFPLAQEKQDLAWSLLRSKSSKQEDYGVEALELIFSHAAESEESPFVLTAALENPYLKEISSEAAKKLAIISIFMKDYPQIIKGLSHKPEVVRKIEPKVRRLFKDQLGINNIEIPQRPFKFLWLFPTSKMVDAY